MIDSRGAAEAESGAETTRRRRIPGWLATVLNVLAALVVVALVQAFLLKVYSVPSGSMENTLNVGDRILVNRLAYGDSVPASGDVVVFRGGEDWRFEFSEPEVGPLQSALRGFGDLTGIGPSNEKFLVKRVVGGPGSTVECCSPEGAVQVDGQPVAEDYVFEDLPFAPGELDCSSEPVSFRCFGPVEVPDGQLLVLGDHRGASSDSVANCRGRNEEIQATCARFAAVDDVVGKVVAKIWPPADWRTF